MKARIEYFACLDEDALLGVSKKIRQTVLSLNKAGYGATASIISPSLGQYLLLARKIALSKADVVIMRIHPYIMPIIFISFLILRLRRRRIIVDIPTPSVVALREIAANSEMSLLGRSIRVALLLVSVPWALVPVHRVVQYANDSSYFSLFLARRTRLSANGIDVDSVPVWSGDGFSANDEFVMIGVASLADWHGFDLVILGMSQMRASAPLPVRFVIVGDGYVSVSLKELVEELALGPHVEFVGRLEGEALDKQFDRAHVGISSLALFRKGLVSASSLKSREYVARGLPFVYTGYDSDFDPLPSFAHQTPNIDEPVNIAALLDWYGGLRDEGWDAKAIRSYAKEHLDLSHKIKVFTFEDSI